MYILKGVIHYNYVTLGEPPQYRNPRFYKPNENSHRFKAIMVSEVKQNVFQLKSASKFKKDPLLLRLAKNNAGIMKLFDARTPINELNQLCMTSKLIDKVMSTRIPSDFKQDLLFLRLDDRPCFTGVFANKFFSGAERKVTSVFIIKLFYKIIELNLFREGMGSKH